VTGLGRHEPDTHGGAAGGPQVLVDRAAHDLAALGDGEDLVPVLHDEGADEAAALLVGQRHGLDAHAAAALDAVVGDRRPLGEPAVGDGEDVLTAYAEGRRRRGRVDRAARLGGLHGLLHRLGVDRLGVHGHDLAVGGGPVVQ